MAKKPPPGLTPKEIRFAQEYSADLNGSRAASRAGYKHPHVVGSQTLAKPRVKEYVQQLQGELVERTAVTKDWVVFETVATYRHARQVAQIAAARGCLQLLALMHGHIVERKDIRVINDVKDLSDEELARIAATVIEGELSDGSPATDHVTPTDPEADG